MSAFTPIKTALISVFNKNGLSEILAKLHREGVELYSTGGTQRFIESLGIPCRTVERVTGYPAILGGRVKTLHPAIFGGILNRRGNPDDASDVRLFNIPPIDLVLVDLYPFEETLATGAGEEEVIEKIDIGGVSLIRAGAKNYRDVLVVASQAQYAALNELLERQGAQSTLDERRWFAKEAFAVSSGYDTAIFNYFDGGDGSYFRQAANNAKTLRYGENPHQKGVFYGKFDALFEQLHGKEISYNNLLDIHAAVDLMGEFDAPTFAILKHNNACGAASRSSMAEAWKDALAGDPVSAFGGILICNAVIDAAAAEAIHPVFFEVIIAPAYEAEALNILKEKKNRIILVQKQRPAEVGQFRSLLNGVLAQDKDSSIQTAGDLQIVTEKAPGAAEVEDLLFANKLVKHTKSNAIILVKNKQLCASGMGQTSRVDALKQAIERGRGFGFDLKGAVMASDAFFPFPDCVEIAAEAGIRAVVQPGGSVKDGLSIEYCNKNNIAMAMTGVRHFKH
jgi:phosphoribosylaminoimidazolecarboxamide formyltransferase/IMP cyclohydrolase